MLMQALMATEVRRNWSSVFDSVVRQKPQPIRKNRDHAWLINDQQLKDVLSRYRFTLKYEVDETGAYCGHLEEIDIVCDAPNLEELKKEMARDLIEYAKEYMEDFQLYYVAPNRKKHFPYVLHVLNQNNIQEVAALLDAEMEGA
ncbi:hypothetical protein I8U21_03970 [Thermoactinomyces sp. CICC 23799]|nr:hypothetical protein [Thermoactinomyces sp. CICC 23799]